MKKLFTLLVLMACFLGTNAKEVVDVEVDYTTATTWSHGWIADQAAPLLEFVEGVGIHFSNAEAIDPFYNVQFQPFPGIPSGAQDEDYEYTYTIKIKGTVEQALHASFSGADLPGEIPVTLSEETVTFTAKTNPSAPYFANSYTLLVQCGDYVGEWWITYVKITHEEAENVKPITWINFIENGDASAAWANPDAMVQQGEYAYVGEGAEQVCAYAKEYGYNENIPHAAFIMEDDEQHGGVFYTTTVPCEEVGDPGWQWANQFWINFPRPLKEGEHLRLSFDYKASEAASGSAQGHRLPGDYLGGGFGDIAFTTEWQNFEQEFDAGANQQSLAFNLGINGQYAKEITFYFDNIKLEYMDLETGLFVAFTDTQDGDPAYGNYDDAISFEEDPTEEGFFVATVGGESEDKWVDEVMISTVRGNKKGFESGTLKVDGDIVNDEEVWLSYAQVGKTKTKLPVRGQWQISIDTKSTQINFIKLAGEEDKEILEVIPNPTEFVIAGTERTEQDWDNQFWIAANRDLAAGEKVLIEFDYWMESDEVEEAGTDIQAHKVGDDGAPCTYLDWNTGLPGANFTATLQHYSQVWTVPSASGGMRSICFNMAKVTPAVKYYISNVVWMSSDLTEYLVDPKDEGSFGWRKIGKGGYYQYPAEPQPASTAADPNINGDEAINGQDLQALINAIVDESTDIAKFDINGDGEINGQDIQALINIIVKQE